MKKLNVFICLVLVLSLLAACQEAPETQSVISKNDGAFDENAALSASETHAADATQAAQYTDSFTSTDGSVEFQITIDESLLDVDMPVLEAQPYILTAEDAQTIEQALFGDSLCYDQVSKLYPVYTKSQLQERINRWSVYASSETERKKLFGDNYCNVEVITNFISEYTALLETASDNDPTGAVQWAFKNSDYYYYTEEELAENGVQGNFDLIAMYIEANGISYSYNASIRDNADSKLSKVSVFPGSGSSPQNIDERIYAYALCSMEAPTQAQLDNASEIAMELLNAMNLGEWAVADVSTLSDYKSVPNLYAIQVRCTPVLQGVPTAWIDNDAFDTSGSYAFSYYETNAELIFSANGTFVSMDLYSPITILNAVNDNVQTLTIDALIGRAKQQLMLSDAYSYGASVDALKKLEDISCEVTVDSINYTLYRVAKKDSDTTFYYVPAITLSGNVIYCGKSSGTVYYDEEATFLCLNAVDGSVIEQ